MNYKPAPGTKVKRKNESFLKGVIVSDEEALRMCNQQNLYYSPSTPSTVYVLWNVRTYPVLRSITLLEPIAPKRNLPDWW